MLFRIANRSRERTIVLFSLPDGAPAAARAFKAAYEWLIKFDKIVLCFDNDEVGQKATQQVAEMLPVGKAYVSETAPQGRK
jgi:hypothetical protein